MLRRARNERYAVGGCEQEDEKHVKRYKKKTKYFAKLLFLYKERSECLGIQSSDTRKPCHVKQPFTIRLKSRFSIPEAPRYAM